MIQHSNGSWFQQVSPEVSERASEHSSSVSIAYYDQETISPSDVAESVKRLGPNALHVHRDGVVWPVGCDAQTETIWQPRDDRFRAIAMDFLDQIRSRMPSIDWRG